MQVIIHFQSSYRCSFMSPLQVCMDMTSPWEHL
jgi:hypothetical protein